mmetsp:Transcript_58635/g.137290  ORF Transcript_58635/g.137290 Transcript_58635/m.137290 type:complete len:236 (+) Transcript_58635:70-777(+)
MACALAFAGGPPRANARGAPRGRGAPDRRRTTGAAAERRWPPAPCRADGPEDLGLCGGAVCTIHQRRGCALGWPRAKTPGASPGGGRRQPWRPGSEARSADPGAAPLRRAGPTRDAGGDRPLLRLFWHGQGSQRRQRRRQRRCGPEKPEAAARPDGAPAGGQRCQRSGGRAGPTITAALAAALPRVGAGAVHAPHPLRGGVGEAARGLARALARSRGGSPKEAEGLGERPGPDTR